MRIVIMGGTAGIGLATAEKLTARGDDVVVTGRDPARLAAVDGRAARAEHVDGASAQQVADFFAREGEFDHLVLAFSAGSIGLQPVRDISVEDVRTAFEGKLFGYLNAVRHAKVTGSITMVSAASARAALPTTALLAAVNGGIERMVSPLAAELAPVRVNAVSPGVVNTAWWSFIPEDQRSAQLAGFGAQLPVGRVGRAEEVADAIVYLIDAGFVTSTVLSIDGGATVA